MQKAELLMPAGSMDKLKFAIAYGADAVFAGVPMYALRAKENNFQMEFLEEAVNYCRERGKKIYLTTNILARNFKIPPFLKAFEQMQALKPDAFIVADPGLILLIKKHFPEAEVHLSVQENTMNWAAVQFWAKQGVSRVILSRELSLGEVEEIITKNPQTEIEVFVHGAICMAHSGRCLISNYLTGRDANMGLCAQSCRWQWKLHTQEPERQFFVEEKRRQGELHEIAEDEFGTYLMSSKDLCALEQIADLIKIGVKSLKVEGRNKTLYYTAIVARAYRTLLDNPQADLSKLWAEVKSTANRGFIPGFLMGDLAEQSIEYGERSSHSTHEFAGVVHSYNSETNEVELEPKNRLETTEELEFCFPNMDDDFKLSNFTMRFVDGEKTSVAHGGDKWVMIKIPEKQAIKFQGEIFCVVRKKLP